MRYLDQRGALLHSQPNYLLVAGLIIVYINFQLMMRNRPQRKKRILSHGNEKYHKLSYRSKIVLLKKVLYDHCEIKQTAHLLDINYSTAKTLMRRFKNYGEDIDMQILKGISDWFEIYEVERERCTYKTIENTKIEEERRPKKARKETGESMSSFTKIENEIEHLLQERATPTPITILQQVFFRE